MVNAKGVLLVLVVFTLVAFSSADISVHCLYTQVRVFVCVCACACSCVPMFVSVDVSFCESALVFLCVRDFHGLILLTL